MLCYAQRAMQARQQADFSEAGFAKLAPFFLYILFSVFVCLLFLFVPRFV